MSQRVLVIGAGGFLGSHLCQALSQWGYQVAAVGHAPRHRDKSPYEHLSFFRLLQLPDPELERIVAEFQPEAIAYCAGTASVPQSVQSPYCDFQQSVAVCAFVLETIRTTAPACQFVFCSSAAVYGNPQAWPIPETAPLQPVSPYGYHKRLCELLIEEYQHLYGVKSSVLRIFSAYGERLQKQILYDLCCKVIDPDLPVLELYGTGQESRDFIHASDVAQALHWLLRTQHNGLYNLGTGVQTTIATLVSLLKETAGCDKPVVFNQQVRAGDPLHWQADIRAMLQVGFTPQMTLAQGVQQYWSWFSSIH